MAYTRDDGWVWVFVCVDHFTAEAWAHVSASGDRHAALQPVYDAVVDRWGELGADIGRGLALRHDWGPQYRSAHFLGSLRWLGIADDLLRRRARVQRLRRAVDQDFQGAVPVGPHVRRRR